MRIFANGNNTEIFLRESVAFTSLNGNRMRPENL